jgi:hypothetical protein
MPDLSFLASFASHPVTLSILTVGAIVIIFMVKVFPHMQELKTAIVHSDEDLKSLLTKVIASDEKQAAQIEELKLNVRNNVLDTLRLTIYTEHIAIEDRLVAARRYFILGGNGKVAEYVTVLARGYQDHWKAILAMSKPDEKAKLEEIIKL